MIDRGSEEVAVKCQAELLEFSRSNVYYVARPLPERDLALMRRLDELHLELPFFGARELADALRREGHEVGRLHVTTLMRRMGIEAQYRRPRTSIPARGAAIYPYLLSGLAIERPNQVWSSDITYLPMAHGFMYLVAIVDVASRKVLAFRLSNTLTADFCVEALQKALGKFGVPEIFNTDQGSQFTSHEWIQRLKEANVAISMDGKGRWIDNVFIERLWRSVKYEEVYLHAYANGTEARMGLTRYFSFYNARRSHQSLEYQTPDEMYFGATAASTPVAALEMTANQNPRASAACGGRLRCGCTINKERTDKHHQPPSQIHLSQREICSKKRSQPSVRCAPAAYVCATASGTMPQVPGLCREAHGGFNRDRHHLSHPRVGGAARMNGNPIACEVLA
jgi:putative transposase